MQTAKRIVMSRRLIYILPSPPASLQLVLVNLQIAYHNIFLMFLGMSKYESTSYLYTLFDIQCCQSVIRKLVYGFMCRLDSSVNCIIKGILATSLRYTSRIRKHCCSLLYINS